MYVGRLRLEEARPQGVNNKNSYKNSFGMEGCSSMARTSDLQSAPAAWRLTLFGGSRMFTPIRGASSCLEGRGFRAARPFRGAPPVFRHLSRG